jgi:hypothetical protein
MRVITPIKYGLLCRDHIHNMKNMTSQNNNNNNNTLLSTKLSADGPALRPDGPRSGRSAPVGRTVRACAEQIRVPSFVLRLLAKIMG